MIQFDGTTVQQSGVQIEKTWGIPELFETCNPLDQEPLADRNALFRQILPILFEYPRYHTPPQWTIGDHVASDFVILRDYGVEYGCQNWHDGLVSLNFISFKYCLYGPEYVGKKIEKDILADIMQRIM